MHRLSKINLSPFSKILKPLFFSDYTTTGKNTFLYYPVFNDPSELAHHYYAACYFLPMTGHPKPVFPISSRVVSLLSPDGRPPIPGYFGDIPNHHPEQILFRPVKKDRGLMIWLLRYRPTNLMIWNRTQMGRLSEMLTRTSHMIEIDRNRSTWGCYQYPEFKYRFVSQGTLDHQRKWAKHRFLSFIESLPHHSKAYIFGTGPSVESAYKYDFSDGYRIICNTIVKDKNLLQHIKPHFIIAADAIYHFGISRYAFRFRKDLASFLDDYNALFLMPEAHYPNFIDHHPQYKQSTVPIPYDAKKTNLFMKERFQTKTEHNVLNQLLLPLASSLADEIYLLGFDGRSPSDKRFWRSTANVNYEDLKKYHEAAHPGFFRGIDYHSYADLQAQVAERIISEGESLGKRYHCLNESSNPALQRRYSAGNEN
jgi:hypothetical protein